MIRRVVVTVILAFIVLLAAGSYFAFERYFNGSGTVKNQSTKVSEKDTDKSAVNEKKAEEDTQEQPTIKEVDIIKSENINVFNNSPEYDLKAVLHQNGQMDSILKLEYYIDGTSVTKEFTGDAIPEVKDLFRNREGALGTEKGSRIQNISLNPAKAKVYFLLEGRYVSGEADTKLYSINLKDASVKKLFEGTGRYGSLAFSKDNKYFALNYTWGTSVQSSQTLANSVRVVDCDGDSLAVNRNNDAKGAIIGGVKDNTLKYEYSYLSWSSNTVIKVKELQYNKDKNGTVSGLKGQRELLYDIVKNTLTNTDGSPISQGATSSTSSAAQLKVESDSIKALRSYYGYMSSEQYAKANTMLDDKFRLELGIFKQFGVDYLEKGDMATSEMSVYGALFKASRIDSIVSEKLNGNDSTIYFYLAYTMGEGAETKQALVASLNKSGKSWKILSVKDGNEKESPFKK